MPKVKKVSQFSAEFGEGLPKLHAEPEKVVEKEPEAQETACAKCTPDNQLLQETIFASGRCLKCRWCKKTFCPDGTVKE